MKYKFILKNKYGFDQDELNLYQSLNDGILAGIENQFISQKKYNELRQYLDSASWRSVIHNKWITANYFNSTTIKQPKTFGLLHPGFGLMASGQPLRSPSDLEAMVKEQNLGSFVLKHIGGGMGNSVFIIEKIQKENGHLTYYTSNNRKLDKHTIQNLLSEKVGRLQGYIAQEKLELHPSFLEITGGGMSSIRFYTFCNASGECKPHAAFIRFGSKNGATHHSYYGGVMATVELKSGLVQQGIYLKKGRDWLSHHPETDVQFEGFKIPSWHSLVEQVLHTAKRCPGLNWVGWDFVITKEGPHLIEGNVGDTDFASTQQLFGGFIANGIFDDWMQGLDLSDYEINNYNFLGKWKKNYMKQILKRLIPFR